MREKLKKLLTDTKVYVIINSRVEKELTAKEVKTEVGTWLPYNRFNHKLMM